MAEQIVGPDAQGNYSLVRDGVVVQTWNPNTTFAPGVQSAQRTGKTSGFDASGNPLPPVQGIPATPEGVAQATMPVDPLAAAPVADDWFAAPAPSAGAMRRGTTAPAYAGGGGGYQSVDAGGGDWFAAPSGSFGGTMDPMGAIPNYQDGSRHPAAGGAPRIPGGEWAMADDGEPGRQMTQYDTGASAGPYGVSSPEMDVPSQYQISNVQRMHGYSPPGSGGPRTHPLYDRFAAKGQAMESKVRGMADQIGGGGGSASGGTTSSQDYAQTGKQMDRAYDRYNEALNNPEPLPVHGWAKKQGFKPGTIEAVLGDPTLVLPSAVPGYASENTFGSEAIEAMPMTDLALISFGTQGKRGLTTKTPVVKPPKILRTEAGVKPIKPENKRTLDPAAVTNKVAGMWRSLNEPGVSYGDLDWMNRDALMGNLATADRGSILRQNLTTQFETDPNAAMQSVASYLRSAMSTGPQTLAQRALIEDVDRRITNYGDDLLRMKPGRASRVINELARSY